MKFNAVCENDVCVGECICSPWYAGLEEPDTYKRCLSCKAPLSDEDDPDLCEKCGLNEV
jgi:hypothetical protein